MKCKRTGFTVFKSVIFLYLGFKTLNLYLALVVSTSFLLLANLEDIRKC